MNLSEIKNPDISLQSPETSIKHADIEVAPTSQPETHFALENTASERLENLNSFQPSGDNEKDIEAFLTMTGRGIYLDEIKSGNIDSTSILSEIKDFQTNSLSAESKFHKVLDSKDPEFQNKSRIYQEIPKREIEIIESILNGNAQEDQMIIKASDERPLEEQGDEGSRENQEKNERIRQINERIESGFISAKENILAMERRYDELFGTATEKFSSLSERFPSIITPDFITNIDQKNKMVKSAYAKMFVIYKKSDEQLQSMIQSLPVEYLSIEQIDLIDRSVDKLFDTITSGEEKINDKLDYLESTIQRIPDLRKATEESFEVQDIKSEIEESDLVGNKNDREINLHQ